MRLRELILAAAFAACPLVPSGTRAQDPAPVQVRPGSPLLDASRIAARTDTFALQLESGPGIQLVIRTTALGDTALLRVERMSFLERELDVDSFVVRRPTLAPLYRVSRGVTADSRLTFPPGRVEGTYRPADGPERTISEPLSPPAFYSNSIDLVLAALPLEAGRSFTLGVWSPTGLDGELSARVVGVETVFTADGAWCEAWRVETEGETGAASVYWIAKSTRSLLAYFTEGMQIRIVRHVACQR